MRHFKYLPPAMMAVLFALWLVSIWHWIGFSLPIGKRTIEIGVCEGNLQLQFSSSSTPAQWFHVANGDRSLFVLENLGHLQWEAYEHGGTRYSYWRIPLVLILTVLLPCLLGSLSHGRLRLWHWFALTAMIGIELAYQN
jgi:hypothetical protein